MSMSMLQRTIKVLQQLPKPHVQVNSAFASAISPSISLSPFALTLTLKTSTAPPPLLSATLSALHRGLQPSFPLKRTPLPTHLEKWTLLASPFTHKTARTQLERRTAALQLRVEGVWGAEGRERVIWWVKRVVPGDVEVEVTIHERLAV